MAFNYENSFDKRQNIEPARSYLWRVELPNISVRNTTSVNTSAMQRANDLHQRSQQNYTEEFMQEFNTRVTEANTPYFVIDTDKAIDGGTYWYTARHNDIGNITITIDEDQYGSTFDYFDSWKNMIINRDGTYNPPAFWKRTIVLWRLNLMKMDFQAFYYDGYFPSEISPTQNSYEDGIAQYSVSFTGDSYDKVTLSSGRLRQEYNRMTGQFLSETGYPDSNSISNAIKDNLFSVGTNLARNALSGF